MFAFSARWHDALAAEGGVKTKSDVDILQVDVFDERGKGRKYNDERK